MQLIHGPQSSHYQSSAQVNVTHVKLCCQNNIEKALKKQMKIYGNTTLMTTVCLAQYSHCAHLK